MNLYRIKHQVFNLIMAVFGQPALVGLGKIVIPRKGIIFTGHHVLPESGSDLSLNFSPNRMLEVTPTFLGAVIEYVMQEGYEIISIEEVPDRLADPLSKPFAVFTFDDGYQDNIEHALPVFEKYNVPFCIYITGNFIERKAILWWKLLENIIAQSNSLSPVDGLPFSEKISCVTVSEKYKAWDIIYWAVRSQASDKQCELVVSLAKENEITLGDFGCESIMSQDDISMLSAHPLVSIGAHTMSHSALAKLEPEDVRNEMHESAEYLSALLGESPETFSYPFGDSASAGKREAEIAREVGFSCAVTTRKNLIQSGQDPFFLPRVSLNGYHQNINFLRAMLAGFLLAGWSLFDRGE